MELGGLRSGSGDLACDAWRRSLQPVVADGMWAGRQRQAVSAAISLSAPCSLLRPGQSGSVDVSTSSKEPVGSPCLRLVCGAVITWPRASHSPEMKLQLLSGFRLVTC